MKFLLLTTKATSSLLALQAASWAPQQAHAVSVLSSLSSTKESTAAKRYVSSEIEAVSGDARGCWVKEDNADPTKSFVSCPNNGAAGRDDSPGTNWNAGTMNNKGEPDAMNYIVRIKGTGATQLKIQGTFVTQSSAEPGTSGSDTSVKDDSIYVRWDDAEGAKNSPEGHWVFMGSGTTPNAGLDYFEDMTYKDAADVSVPITLTGSDQLTEGYHKLSIFVREDGTRMGRLRLDCAGAEAEFVAAVCIGSPITNNFACTEFTD